LVKVGRYACARPRGLLLDFRVDDFAAIRVEAIERTLLVGAHEARVPRRIGGEYRGETPDRSHCFGSHVSSIGLIIAQTAVWADHRLESQTAA